MAIPPAAPWLLPQQLGQVFSCLADLILHGAGILVVQARQGPERRSTRRCHGPEHPTAQ